MVLMKHAGVVASPMSNTEHPALASPAKSDGIDLHQLAVGLAP